MICDLLADKEIKRIVDDWFLETYPRGYTDGPMPLRPLFDLIVTVLDRAKPDSRQELQRVLDSVMEQLQARGLTGGLDRNSN